MQYMLIHAGDEDIQRDEKQAAWDQRHGHMARRRDPPGG